MRSAITLLGVILLPAACGKGSRLVEADLALVNGQFWTGVPGETAVQALAVRDGRLLAVGSNSEIQSLVGEGTELVDLDGRFGMPGFIDNHTHFVEGGFSLLGPDLRTASTPEEFVRRITQKAETTAPGAWITGGNWDHQQWLVPDLPRKELIDPVTPENPVFVNRLDGHMALANSLALRLAGVDRSTPDPPGGLIVRDESGEPTGILKDAAMTLVLNVIPPASDAQLEAAIGAALAEAARVGVTTVNAMASYREVNFFHRLELEDQLSARIYAISPLEEYSKLMDVGISRSFGGDFLRVGALKAFIDGSLGSSTAWFYESYADDLASQGLPSDTFLAGQLEPLIQVADFQGYHIAVHAIGDRANDELLNIFERTAVLNGFRDRRFRIEHAQHLRPSIINRFSTLGVIASAQPYHAIDDGRWAERKIGRERIRYTYPFKSLLLAGATVTFGSDWPVAPLSPLLGVYAAVTRRTLDGKNPGGWVPEEKLTVEEALRCYTVNNAFAIFRERDLGTLEPGKLADVVVLSHDPNQLDPGDLDKIEVLRTIVGGRTVYLH